MRIAVIDLDSVCFSALHGNKIIGEDGTPLRTEDGSKFLYKEKTEEEVIFSCDFFIDEMLRESKATHYIALIKGKNTTKNRLAVNPDYKGNRPKESPKYWDLCKQHFIENWGAIEVNDMEVDDAVAICYYELVDAFICAIDNDLLGLSTHNKLSHFNWRKKEFYTVSDYDASYKFWSDMICGQKGDNIQGLKGKGEKFAEKLLQGDGMFKYSEKAFPTKVLFAYLEHYKDEHEAIVEYTKNYISLKIIDSVHYLKDEFKISIPIEFNPIEKETTIQFTEEINPDPSTLKPNDDVLEDKWFEDFKPTELPEIDF